MINIGIVGCGYWGPNIIRNFMAIEECWISYVCDIREENLKKIKTRYPSLNVTTSYDDLVNVKNLHAIVIATPVSTHYDFAREALLKGKHVLIEKPMTTTVAEAEDLISIAKEKKLSLMVDHTFVYTGPVRKIKEIIDSGELGELLYFDSVRVNLGLFQKDINVLWDLAPHDFSIMDYALNKKPLSIIAIGVCHVKNKLENIAYVVVEFPNNLIAHFHFNWLAPVKVRRTLVGGNEKMIVYDDLELGDKVKVYSKKVALKDSPGGKYQPLYDYRIGDMHSPKVDLTEGLQTMCQEFIASIIERRSALTDGEAGLRVVKLLETAQLSMNNHGKRIEL